MKVRTVSTLALVVFALLLASCAEDHSAESDSAPSASDLSQSLGFDPAELDEALHPGDDFFAYVNGKWVTENEIPADRSRYGAFDILRDKSDEDVKAIIEAASATENEEGSDQ